jgi:hypothetical protein
MEMEMRESSGPALATRGFTICMIVLDDLLFLKARRQGRGEDVKWHEYALVVGTRNTDQPISTYLTLSVRGARQHECTDRRECDALAQVKARGEDRRANHEAAPMKLNGITRLKVRRARPA